MAKAVFPGTFDPATYGHLDIIGRASGLVDELTVLVVYNSAKKTIFTFEERISLLKEVTGHFENVRVAVWDGMTAEYAAKQGAVLVRGVRDGSDYDYEARIAEVNRQLTGVETLFLSARPEYSYLSSSVVKEVFRYGGDLDKMVPGCILEKLKEKFQRERY